jgi:hypothetical protein
MVAQSRQFHHRLFYSQFLHFVPRGHKGDGIGNAIWGTVALQIGHVIKVSTPKCNNDLFRTSIKATVNTSQ